ncbi:hypothetical protein QFZ55_000803 [Streptomyces luteogriseus]|nr:hypothetical protein [Streptomyces luteogriseus]
MNVPLGVVALPAALWLIPDLRRESGAGLHAADVRRFVQRPGRAAQDRADGVRRNRSSLPTQPDPCRGVLRDIRGTVRPAGQGTGGGIPKPGVRATRHLPDQRHGPGFGQQELLQDDELLPHEDELLPHDDELVPQDEELPLEQPLEEPSLVPASHQDEWSTGPPASCAVFALCVPELVGHPPRPGPALEPRAVARTPRSSQARRHARRTIKMTTATNASTNPLINTNAINTTPPFRRAAPGLPAACPGSQ